MYTLCLSDVPYFAKEYVSYHKSSGFGLMLHGPSDGGHRRLLFFVAVKDVAFSCTFNFSHCIQVLAWGAFFFKPECFFFPFLLFCFWDHDLMQNPSLSLSMDSDNTRHKHARAASYWPKFGADFVGFGSSTYGLRITLIPSRTWWAF